MLSETLLFVLAFVDCTGILFILVYTIFTLSDLENDYLNAIQCCEVLNYCVRPKYIAQGIVTFLFLIHGRVWLFVANLPMLIWLTFEHFTVPQWNVGAFDPAEIHNRDQLREHIRTTMIKIGHYLVFFFIYIYMFILAISKGNPIKHVSDDGFITEL